MLDVISGGRVISGFVRGIGAEYQTFQLDPDPVAEPVPRGARPHRRGLDPARPVRVVRPPLQAAVRQPVAAPAAAAAPADLEPVPGQRRDRRLGRPPPVHLPADLQRHRHAPARVHRVPRGGRAVRLHGRARAARLGRAGLPGRHRRAGAAGSRPAPRFPVQHAAADAQGHVLPARLPDHGVRPARAGRQAGPGRGPQRPGRADRARVRAGRLAGHDPAAARALRQRAGVRDLLRHRPVRQPRPRGVRAQRPAVRRRA